MSLTSRDGHLRHDHLFALIRQKHQADKSASLLRKKIAPKATAADIEKFKTAAARSLQASA